MNGYCGRVFAAGLLGCVVSMPAVASDRVNVMIFDASGSMWAQMDDGRSRIEIAREVVAAFSQTRDSAIPLGVVAYGHNRRGDCQDIEAILPLGQHEGGAFSDRLNALNPRGMTPLTDSMAMARDMIPRTAEAADIILVTDGLENCDGDPCALAREIAADGIDIRAHVVGFALSDEETAALSCVPEETGGQLFTTNSGSELSAALTQVSETPASRDMPAPIEAPASEIPDVMLTAPDTVGIRENFDIALSEAVDGYLLIVPTDTPSDEKASRYQRDRNAVDGDTEVSRTAPSQPGVYQLRLHRNEDHRVVAQETVEVQDIEATIDAPAQVEADREFPVTVDGGVSGYVVIVDPDRPEDDIVSRYYRMRDSVDGSGEIVRTAPEESGPYEIRYYSGGGHRLLARQSIEVVEGPADD